MSRVGAENREMEATTRLVPHFFRYWASISFSSHINTVR
jgi:hypothetical protein